MNRFIEVLWGLASGGQAEEALQRSTFYPQLLAWRDQIVARVVGRGWNMQKRGAQVPYVSASEMGTIYGRLYAVAQQYSRGLGP